MGASEGSNMLRDILLTALLHKMLWIIAQSPLFNLQLAFKTYNVQSTSVIITKKTLDNTKNLIKTYYIVFIFLTYLLERENRMLEAGTDKLKVTRHGRDGRDPEGIPRTCRSGIEWVGRAWNPQLCLWIMAPLLWQLHLRKEFHHWKKQINKEALKSWKKQGRGGLPPRAGPDHGGYCIPI